MARITSLKHYNTSAAAVSRALDGSKIVEDDGVSADKRDEDQPTIDEECPSCR